LLGQNIGEATLNEMGEIIAIEAVPMDDNRGSADY
jgi:hypothetical protein